MTNATMKTNVLPAVFLSSDPNIAKRNPNDSIVSNAQIVQGRKYITVPVTEIDIDMPYQRHQSEAAINKLVANWDEDKYEPIKVAYRDGRFKAWDGGKRLQAQMEMGRVEVDCRLCRETTLLEEAKSFAHQGDCVTKLKAADIYRCNILLGDPIDTAINDLCHKYCILVPVGRGKVSSHTLGSITEAREIVKAIGKDGFDWLLGFIHNSHWRFSGRAYASPVLRALKNVYLNHREELNTVSKKLAKRIESDENIKSVAAWQKNSVLKYPEMDKRTAMHTYLEEIISQIK